MKTLSYHRATTKNVDMICEMRIAFLNSYHGEQSSNTPISLKENLKKYFNTALENNSAICWYAKSGNDIAGIGFMEIHDQPGNFKNPVGKIGHVMNMYTIKNFRRNGICTAILNKLVESAKQLGVNAFELHASEEGMPVYLKNGFHLHKEPTMRMYLNNG